MRFTKLQLALVLVIGIIIGYFLSNPMNQIDGFQSLDASGSPVCSNCGGSYPCQNCDASSSMAVCNQGPPLPDMSKYVLKTSIPPCQTCPDLSMYMLKTECPSAVDLSHYVLKSSIPKPEPIIVDNSSCRKDCGDCPPCPRPRCPEMNCPPPTKCPACPPCPRQKCPEKVVKCKAEEVDNSQVRPYLTPLSVSGFGSA